MITSAAIAGLLNDLVKLDREAVRALVAAQVPCNGALADHPSVACDCRGDECRVGLLGIVEGITRLDGETIEAIHDVDPGGDITLVGFRVRDRKLRPVGA